MHTGRCLVGTSAYDLNSLITLSQVLWFNVNCIGRLAQHLELTTLELTTAGFVCFTFATSFCWWYKPSDVGMPIILNTCVTIQDILKEVSTCTLLRMSTLNRLMFLRQAGPTAEAPYGDTPLDFISHNDWFMNVLWKYYIEILNKIHLRIFWRHNASRPINHLPSDSWPVMSLGLKVCSSFLVHSYSAIFVLGWNFYFPSRTEQILWRVSSTFTLMYGALGVVCGGYCMYFLQPLGDRRLPLTPKITIPQTVGCWSKRVTKFTRRLRNNSPDHDPSLTIPLRMLVPSSILCLLYVFSRAYILLEDAIGLRKLPSRAFETVNWPQFMPHL